MASAIISPELSAALEVVRQAATTGDELTKDYLANFAQEITIEVEEPIDYVNRIGYTSFQMPVIATIGCAHGIFKHVVERAEGVSVEELQKVTSIDRLLLTRILRAMVWFRMLDSPRVDVYTANKSTKALIRDYSANALMHFIANTGPGTLAIIPWLEAQVQQKPSNRTPYQVANNTDRPLMEAMNFDYFSGFLRYLSEENGLKASWLDVYHLQDALNAAKSTSPPFFIDIGGSMGHQTAALLRRYPNAPSSGKCIVQDLPQVVEQAKAIPGQDPNIEFKASSFFEPQPESDRGARIYYMRYIMHDWRDAECVKILSHLKDAMAEDSVIVIDEVLVPEHADAKNGSWIATCDLVMLAMTDDARERTVKEFEGLVRQVGGGLEVKVAKVYDERRGNGVVVVGKV